MSVSYHAWTHTADGTDPIPFPAASDLKWANAIQFDAAVSKSSGAYYIPRFQYCATNDPTYYELQGLSSGKADYLAVLKAGVYVLRAGVTTRATTVWGANYAILEVVAVSGGVPSQFNATTDGFSDWTGSDYARGHEQYNEEYVASTDGLGHRGLWLEYTFNYEPDNPNFGDISYENPLQLGLRVLTDQTGTVNITGSLHLTRIAGGGYTLQDVT